MVAKNYYKFQELIYSLRDEYLKNQKLINELKKLIEIESKGEITSSLFLKQQLNYYKIEDYPTLLLRVRRRQKFIKKSLIQLENDFPNCSLSRYRKNNAEFMVKKEKGQYAFYAHNDLNGTRYYNPNVFIRNEKEFGELYKELQHSKLFNLNQETIQLNPFQDVSFNGHSIALNTSDGLDQSSDICIRYNASDDKVYLTQDRIHSIYHIDNLFDTQVPSYLIPDGYLELIENHPTNATYLYSSSDDFYNKEDIIPFFEKTR